MTTSYYKIFYRPDALPDAQPGQSTGGSCQVWKVPN